jgi:glycosyltransferase involved in cell wall biosynthesis
VHNETGKLFDFFGASALAQSVCELLNNPEERKRLGANARAFAQANYDLQTVCLPKQLAWVEKLKEV